MAKKIVHLTESDLHRIVKESVERVINEVKLKGSDGYTYPNLHGNDPNAWHTVAHERFKRASDIDKEIENLQGEGYEDDLFGTVGDLKKEKYRNIWNGQRNHLNAIDADDEPISRTSIAASMHPDLDFSDPNSKQELLNRQRNKLNAARPNMSIKTKSRRKLPNLNQRY